MAENKESLLKMILSLGLITIIAALILGIGYMITKDVIAMGENTAKLEAITKVAPKYDNNPIAEKFIFKAHEGTKDSVTIVVYPAKLNNKLVGAAVESISYNGFAGEVEVMYGFTIDGSIFDYKVLKHTETAGLGSKMEKWFRTDKNRQSILLRNPSKENMTVTKDGGTVDGITAATISSRAFLGALKDASDAFIAYRDGGTQRNE
ncbi:MAG: RnfABCDGE type electron transport complex subunit G [Muribaculaceae bacterium]